MILSPLLSSIPTVKDRSIERTPVRGWLSLLPRCLSGCRLLRTMTCCSRNLLPISGCYLMTSRVSSNPKAEVELGFVIASRLTSIPAGRKDQWFSGNSDRQCEPHRIWTRPQLTIAIHSAYSLTLAIRFLFPCQRLTWIYSHLLKCILGRGALSYPSDIATNRLLQGSSWGVGAALYPRYGAIVHLCHEEVGWRHLSSLVRTLERATLLTFGWEWCSVDPEWESRLLECVYAQHRCSSTTNSSRPSSCLKNVGTHCLWCRWWKDGAEKEFRPECESMPKEISAFPTVPRL